MSYRAIQTCTPRVRHEELEDSYAKPERPKARHSIPTVSIQKLSRQEQETVIRTSSADNFWDVWTCDPKFIRRFAKAGYEPTKQQHGTVFTVPLNGLSIRSAKSLKPIRKLLQHLRQVNQPATEAPTTSESSTGLEKSRLKIVGE